MTDKAPADHSGVIFPPPLIYVAALGIGLAVHYLVLPQGFGLPTDLRIALAAVCGGVGAGFIVSAMARMRALKTDPQPWRPSTTVVSDGVFRLTRNPMYLGMALIHLSLALFADSVWGAAMLVPALLIVRWAVIAREERYMAAKFGQAYLDYKTKVRRWI